MRLPVSVLVPAYNGAAFLPETLDSILSQTYTPVEVVVVDDGSTDNTSEVVASFGRSVRYHFRPNGGICIARNTAASLATSSYLAFCDQDDLWRGDKLMQQMDLHERNPNLEYSFTNFAWVRDGIWSENTKLQDAPVDFFAGGLPAGSAPVEYKRPLYRELLLFQPIWPSTVVVARTLFNRHGGFREEFGKNPSEDLEFTLRCVQQPPVGIVREPVVGVRRHSQNYSGSNDANTRGQIEILEYVLGHHEIDESTRALIREQIGLRRVELSHEAFRRGDFSEYLALVSGVPTSTLEQKAKLKRWISNLPLPIARRLQKLLVKQLP